MLNSSRVRYPDSNEIEIGISDGVISLLSSNDVPFLKKCKRLHKMMHRSLFLLFLNDMMIKVIK
ncbi:hypothetical protein GCM10023211_01430 [Orbus sasakiae]|uniref:Uncharacterized protein n=1 Tax=Orbus sasakiae TaxID=1078475 RepID=A0ABP9MYS6_9GAMM